MFGVACACLGLELESYAVGSASGSRLLTLWGRCLFGVGRVGLALFVWYFLNQGSLLPSGEQLIGENLPMFICRVITCQQLRTGSTWQTRTVGCGYQQTRLGKRLPASCTSLHDCCTSALILSLTLVLLLGALACAGEGRPINLQGIAIGNGLTNPAIQFGAYADFAAQHGLISDDVSYMGESKRRGQQTACA